MTDQTPATPAPEPTSPNWQNNFDQLAKEGSTVIDLPANRYNFSLESSLHLAIVNREHSRYAFVRWMRRRQRLFVFLGVAVVFLTFIVKDALREQLKDQVDAIERAKTLYTVRADTSEILDQVGLGMGDMILNPQNSNDLRLRYYITHRKVVSVESKIILTLTNIYDLVKALDQPIISQMLPAINDLYEESKQYHARMDKLSPGGNSLSDADLDTARSLYTELSHFDVSVFKMGLRVLDKAEEKKVADERHYRVATWASYFLYALGSGLALIGRIFGVETGAGD